MKRLSCIILSLLLFVLLITGCSQQSDAPEATPGLPAGDDTTPASNDAGEVPDFMQGTLRLVGPGFTAEDDVVNPRTGVLRLGYSRLIELFEEDYPDMKLEIDAVPWDSWMASLQTAAAGRMADVLVHGGSIVDVVEDLTPYLENDPELMDELYVKGTFRRPDEQNYDQMALTAIPVGINAYLYVYDKQLFDDFGVPYPDENNTWEDILDKMQQLTGENPKTGEQTYGATINMSGTNLWRPFLSYAMEHDIKVVDHAKNKFETEVLFDSPEVIEIFRFMEGLSETFPESFLENIGHEKFGSNENNVAIYLDVMPFELYQIAAANDASDRYGYAPYPKRADGQGYSFFLGDWNMAIPQTSANKDAAWEFIRWMTTKPEVVDYIMSTGNLPNSRSGLNQLIESGLPFAEPLTLQFTGFPNNFWAASSKYYDNLLGPMESIFVSNITSLYAGHISPEQTGANIQTEMDEFLNSNR